MFRAFLYNLLSIHQRLKHKKRVEISHLWQMQRQLKEFPMLIYTIKLKQ